jgi:hypothetical protein
MLRACGTACACRRERAMHGTPPSAALVAEPFPAWRAWWETLRFSAVLLPAAGLVEHMHVAHCLSKICSENANKLIAQRLLLGSGPLDYTASIHTKHTPDFSR